jgi:hypothetical protein
LRILHVDAALLGVLLVAGRNTSAEASPHSTFGRVVTVLFAFTIVPLTVLVAFTIVLLAGLFAVLLIALVFGYALQLVAFSSFLISLHAEPR